MSLTEKNYKSRLIDDKISEYLKIFGAIIHCWAKMVWKNLDCS